MKETYYSAGEMQTIITHGFRMYWRCAGLRLVLILAGIFGVLPSGGTAELYYTNQNFPIIEFDPQWPGTNDQLSTEMEKWKGIVKGNPVRIDTNGTYAIERNAVVLGYDSATGAWNAVVNYNAPERHHPGKIYDNAGWVRGVKSVNGKWGAYFWTLQNRIAFRSSETNWWEIKKGIWVPITNVIVGSLGNYPPLTNVVDIGPDISLATNFPGTDSGNDGIFWADLTNIYNLS